MPAHWATRTLAVCNVATSAMVRETELSFLTRAGTEIGVASTKAFTTQLAALYMLTLALAKVRGYLTDAQEAEALTNLRHLPAALHGVLALEPQIIAWSEDFARRENALFLGVACITRSPWKARSSSRKSRTSTLKPIRPANSSTARWRS
jgi:glucosamine--fructose-6-phosphate aminotransferase (isomerizing)